MEKLMYIASCTISLFIVFFPLIEKFIADCTESNKKLLKSGKYSILASNL